MKEHPQSKNLLANLEHPSPKHQVANQTPDLVPLQRWSLEDYDEYESQLNSSLPNVGQPGFCFDLFPQSP